MLYPKAIIVYFPSETKQIAFNLLDGRSLIAESQKVQEYIRLSSVQENKDFDKYAKEGEAEAKEYAQKNNKTEHMTDQEIQILAYYIAKDKENGTNLADEYKAAIKHYLKHRRAQEIAASINGIDIPVIEGLTRIGYSLGSGVVDWSLDLAQNFTNQKIDPTVMQMANGYIGSDPSLNGFDRVAHQAAGAVGYMAPSILLSKGVSGLTGMAPLGSAVGSTAMFLGSAGNAYGDALEKGYNQPAARAYSALVGLSEVTLQNILGGISEFGGLPAKLDGKISAIKNALLKGAAKYGISLGSEILEEELQNFLEPAFRSIIFGEKYDMPTVQEIIDTAITAFITTSAIEGPGITSETIKEYGNNNALKTATNSVQPEQSSPNAPETIDVGKIGWDGRVAVTEATGPKVTVGGKTYELIGYDKDGAKVYQDAEVLESVKENATADQKETNPTESGLESVENPENRDTIKLPDIQIGRSLGAKAKNYQVMDMSTGEMFNLVEGTKLQNVEVFAGKGTKTPYRNAYKYANVHGGKVEEWQHVKGEGWVACMDGDRYAEIHWSQCEGRGKHDLFIKRWKDEG